MASEALRAVATGKPPVDAKPIEKLSFYLTKNRAQIAAALQGTLITPEKMSRLALTAFSNSEALQECSITSIYRAVVLAAQMGLEIGVSGHGYIVPYGREATFVPGWQGLVDLVNRSGRASVWTGAVFAGDFFEWELGDRPFIKHQPAGEDDPEQLLYVYAVGRVKGSEWPVIEVWKNDRVVRHRNKYNKVGKKHYSFAHWERYARKIPLLQVLRYMPKSVEVQRAISQIHAAEAGERPVFDADFVVLPDDDNGGAGDSPQQNTQAGNQGGGSKRQPASETKPDPKKDEPKDSPGEPRVRNVIDGDGLVLFQTDGETVVGAKGEYQGKKYTVAKITDSVIQIEYDKPAPTRSLKDSTKLLLEQARDTDDLEVAEAKFDEARTAFSELLPANQEELRALRDEVSTKLAERRKSAL